VTRNKNAFTFITTNAVMQHCVDWELR